jgi:3'-phosphoadenosine 5'-phosphosulfate sulfotransferase (PAPS reductase)/FAD synthetase
MMIKCIVPVSGGKDSQACLELAIKDFGAAAVRGLFCDTQFEHPLTYKHIDFMADLYGVQIDRVARGDVLERCVRFGRFPGGGARHCTDYLKLKPTRDYLREFAKENGPVEVWYGMRSGESRERAARYAGKISDDLYEPHEIMPGKYPKYLGKLGVRFRMPILEWGEKEVFELLGAFINPLYVQGFDRVGCFPCLAAGDATKERAFKFDDFGREQYIKVQDISRHIGKSIWTSKGGKARNEGAGCMLCSI